MAYTPKNPNGSATSANSSPVVIASDQATVPVSLATVPSHAVTLASTTITGSVAVTGAFYQATQPVSLASVPSHAVTNAGTFAVQVTSAPTTAVTGTFWQATQPVSLASVPSHAVTNAGTFVTQENGAALTALQILDNAIVADNAAFVDGTTGLNMSGYIYDEVAGTALTENDAAAARINVNRSQINVIEDGVTRGRYTTVTAANALKTDGSAVTQPVSNAGTFAVQAAATLAAETTKVIGTVNISAAQTLATVTTVSTVTNLSQLGGVAINMNTGVRATGTQRVTIATDDTVQVKNTPDATATYSPSNATTTAYAASLIAKASAGNLYAITGYNSKTTAQFIQVHDAATLPIDTAVPKLLFMVPPASNFSFDLASWGRYFSAGITICNSSTGPTKTIGSADCWFDIQYK